MKKNYLFLILGSIVLTLVGCSTTTVSIRRISSEQLASGKTTKMGYLPVKPEWQCRKVGQKSYNWGADKMKGTLTNFKGPYDYIQKQAIDNANKQHINTNYISINIPQEKSIGGVNLHPNQRAMINYYLCKNPPADQWF